MFGVASVTWREEAVEVSDDGSERGSQRRLVLHAAGDHAGQFSPLRSWELVLVFVEQQLLHDTQEHQLESAARSAGRSAEGPAHLGPVVRRQRVFSAAVDLPQRGAEAPLICCQTQALAVLHALGRNPRDPVHQNYRQKSTDTRQEKHHDSPQLYKPVLCCRNTAPLTFSGLDGDADPRVTELDERRHSCLSVFFSGHQNVPGADVSVDQVLLLLRIRNTW